MKRVLCCMIAGYLDEVLFFVFAIIFMMSTYYDWKRGSVPETMPDVYG